MNAIMVGYQGTRDLLDSIFGKAEVPPVQPQPPPVVPKVVNQASDKLAKITPDAFDRMFADPKRKPH